MEKEKVSLEQQKENINEWWARLWDEWDDGHGKPYLVQEIVRQRPTLDKMPGEDEIFKWLKDGMGNDCTVFLNKNKVMVPKPYSRERE